MPSWPRRKAGGLLGDLNEYFVGFDHAQFAARFFLDHFQAVFQVTHLSGQLVVAGLRLGVFNQLLIELLLQVTHIGHTAATDPELRMEQQQKRNQDGRDDAFLHVQRGQKRSEAFKSVQKW
jgi:hypothetical protein